MGQWFGGCCGRGDMGQRTWRHHWRGFVGELAAWFERVNRGARPDAAVVRPAAHADADTAGAQVSVASAGRDNSP